MKISGLRRISAFEWEIPQGFRTDMRGPVRLIASESLIADIAEDKSLEQAVNATTLPGLAGPVVVMPDIHQGYGFPIGGIAATELPDGAISPGAIGYDINCGVRALCSNLEVRRIQQELDRLATMIGSYCPSGVGAKGALTLSEKELDRVLAEGSSWAMQHGYATEADLDATEDRGQLDSVDPTMISRRAKERGRVQLGSLGAGNHFIELDVVDDVLDEAVAQVFGLGRGHLVVQIHCGSRGLGHQVCTDYVQQFQAASRKYDISLPDRELACAPMNAPEGQAYISAMRGAANFAFANRQVLAHSVRRAFEETLGGATGAHMWQIYDVAHNIGKIETHTIAGRRTRVCVHRKGATRAFGPGAPEIPSRYRATGQPVLVPGSMGTASWVLAGAEGSMEKSWGSACHGAGRVWSRSRAKKEVRGENLRRELESRGIIVRAGSLAGLAEEAPAAYKDVDQVVEIVAAAGIARKVARLRPVAVIKG